MFQEHAIKVIRETVERKGVNGERNFQILFEVAQDEKTLREIGATHGVGAPTASQICKAAQRFVRTKSQAREYRGNPYNSFIDDWRLD